ncbi:CcdC protein domain-containing protein [Paenibacillus sp. R14(2021)]|uniref:CcdC protein domain-containing protein n=1 Tax=Paenibacillus sp. R14(2021) TaxID=2859228 RepID=UPI001C6159F7|nr:CcdC protein domain-containing protein [Paenibacillus sp. R14(2021)]
MEGSSLIIYVVLIGALILWRRRRAMSRPIKGKGLRLLLPAVIVAILCVPVLMEPKVDAAAWEFVAAFAAGAVLSIPLIWTTNYERRDDGLIYAVRNKSFIVSFLAVFIVRFLLRDYLAFVGPETEAALFVILAVGYAVPWRIASYLKFRKLYAEPVSAS